jgi:hypothetical protein
MVWCSHADASEIAAALAEQVSELEPLRREIARRRQEIGEWLTARAAEHEHEGAATR